MFRICNVQYRKWRGGGRVKFKRPTEEAYEELQAAYDYYNDHLFEALLPPCLITFQREKRSMGYFSKSRFIRRDGVQTDEIAMNPDFFAVVPLVEILQTLVHEMAHLWQAHFGTPSRACYHNREWALKMERIGLMPSDTGQPGGKKVGQSMNDYVIPGGRFDKVTRQLLERGLQSPGWIDIRRPISPPASPRKPSRPSARRSRSRAMKRAATPPRDSKLPCRFLPRTVLMSRSARLVTRATG